MSLDGSVVDPTITPTAAPPARLSVHCDGEPTAFDALRDEWTALETRLFPRTPFTGPLWHETWWSHLRRRAWHTRDDLALTAVRDPSGRLVAVAPFMRTHRPGFGPLRVTELHCLGADPHVTELRSIVCDPADQPAVMDALRDHFRAARPRPNWINWHNVRWTAADASHVPPDAMSGARYAWARPQPAYLVDLAATWETFEATLTSRVRKKIRNCTNQIKRDGKSVTLNVVSAPDAVVASLHTFYDLVAMRSEVRHANPFGGQNMRDFFDDYAVRSAQQGQLHVFELKSGDEVVACRIGFALGDQLYLYHSGNQPAWDRFSIMTKLLAEIFRWAIANRFTLVNLSTGLDRSKTRWRPREIMYVDALEIMPGFADTTLHKAYARVRREIENPNPQAFQRHDDGRVSLPAYTAIAEAQDDG